MPVSNDELQEVSMVGGWGPVESNIAYARIDRSGVQDSNVVDICRCSRLDSQGPHADDTYVHGDPGFGAVHQITALVVDGVDLEFDLLSVQDNIGLGVNNIHSGLYRVSCTGQPSQIA